MNASPAVVGSKLAMSVVQLEALIAELRKDGREVVAPTVRDGTLVYDEIHSIDQLPWGWRDEQEAGRYRLSRSRDGGCFQFASPAHSWKQFLHPPEARLYSCRSTDPPRYEEEPPSAPSYAFLGVRPCDLQAIRVLDRVLLEGPFPDPIYRIRREQALVIAVNCTHPGGTCFCASLGNGPQAREGFDLALTETGAEPQPFVLEVGSRRGGASVRNLQLKAATEAQLKLAEAAIEAAVERMGRQLETDHLREDLFANLENPEWEAVAKRCLACANCTMVCPTCFCTTLFDRPNLTGSESERVRLWDSCFNADFSYIHGGAIRPGTASRYRQWLTHKLASWHDQFGLSGCVGCGRCITWCPVGIDLTAEVQAIRQSAGRPASPRENTDGKP